MKIKIKQLFDEITRQKVYPLTTLKAVRDPSSKKSLAELLLVDEEVDDMEGEEVELRDADTLGGRYTAEDLDAMPKSTAIEDYTGNSVSGVSRIVQYFADKLRTIKDYPITLTKAVYNENDERLDSILSTIEGEVNTLNENLSELRKPLVWSNPSPSATFNAQSVNINTTEFDYLKVTFALDKNSSTEFACVDVFKGGSAFVSNVGQGSTTTDINYQKRVVTANADGTVTFSVAETQQQGSETSSSGDYIIPLKIYVCRV